MDGVLSIPGVRPAYAMVVWGLLLAVLAVLAAGKLQWAGDSPEYLANVYSLSSHFSPDVQPADFEAANRTMLERGARGQAQRLMAAAQSEGAPLTAAGARYSGPVIITADGHRYVWHFWFYSALVSLVFAIGRLVALSPASAFVATNCILLALPMAYSLKSWRADAIDRNVLCFLFLASGTTFYVWWPHPEVFTASLLLLGLLLAVDERFCASLLCLAVAATQNPPILLTLPVVGLAYAVRSGAVTIRGGLRFDGGELLRVAGCGAIAALVAVSPVVFYFLATGVTNPIVAANGADSHLISVSRVVSLFFDPSIGIFSGAPGVMLGCIGALFFLLLSLKNRESSRTGLLWLLGAIALSVVLAVPTTATGNWNHGSTVFSRYAYWVAVPLLFGFVVAARSLRPRLRILLLSGAVLTQAAVLVWAGIWGVGLGERDFRPLARIALTHLPALYNPIPEIFAERTAGREYTMSDPQTQALAFAFPPEHPRKLLMHASNPTLRDSCWSARLGSGRASRAEDGWIYFDEPFECTLPQGVAQ